MKLKNNKIEVGLNSTLMGQKVHPVGLRLGISKKPDSQWIPEKIKDYSKLIQEDLWIRRFIQECYPTARISKIHINRDNEKTNIKIIALSRIGTKTTEKIRTYLETGLTAKRLYCSDVNLQMSYIPDLTINAQFLANSIEKVIQRRRSFKMAIKKAIKKTKQKVPKSKLRRKLRGIRIQISGRLNGAEMARTHWVRDGQVPLHTLKADIDYLAYPIPTRYGILGLKIWICNR